MSKTLIPFRSVIVTGTRDWTDPQAVFKVLNKADAKEGIDAIIAADEKGVAEYAIEWAIAKHKTYVVWTTNPADEEPAFTRAGKMLQLSRNASLLIAFPGGYVTDWLAANAKRIYSIPVQFVNP